MGPSTATSPSPDLNGMNFGVLELFWSVVSGHLSPGRPFGPLGSTEGKLGQNEQSRSLPQAPLGQKDLESTWPRPARASQTQNPSCNSRVAESKAGLLDLFPLPSPTLLATLQGLNLMPGAVHGGFWAVVHRGRILRPLRAWPKDTVQVQPPPCACGKLRSHACDGQRQAQNSLSSS